MGVFLRKLAEWAYAIESLMLIMEIFYKGLRELYLSFLKYESLKVCNK